MHTFIAIENPRILDRYMKVVGGCNAPLSFLISLQYINTQAVQLSEMKVEKRSVPSTPTKRAGRSHVSKRKAVDA